MRWDRLFEDLEGQLRDEELAQRDADVVDRIRAERSRIGLGDRLRRHRGPIHLVLARGRLIAQGTPAEIRAHPKVQEVYFGSGKTFEKPLAKRDA